MALRETVIDKEKLIEALRLAAQWGAVRLILSQGLADAINDLYKESVERLPLPELAVSPLLSKTGRHDFISMFDADGSLATILVNNVESSRWETGPKRKR